MLKEYKALAISTLRVLEVQFASDKSMKWKQLETISDDELLLKWLWVVTIVGGLVFFIVLPFFLTVFVPFVPSPVMKVLWFLLKFGMTIILIIGCCAIYSTVHKSKI